MTTFMHYTFTVALQGLVNGLLFWSEFYRPCKFMTETIGPMEGMGLKVTPMTEQCFLSNPRIFGPMAGTLWTYS